MAEPTRWRTPLHLALSQLPDSLSNSWAVPLAQDWCSSCKAHNPAVLLISEREQTPGCVGSKTEKGEWRGVSLPKGGFIWEDTKFETQTHSVMNSSTMSFTSQSVPYSKHALPLSYFRAVTVMGLSDIFQWNNLPIETVVSSQWKLYINSNLLISLPHLLPQICE